MSEKTFTIEYFSIASNFSLNILTSMQIPQPPNGIEKRDRNRLARDLLVQANSHDEFFSAMESVVPNMGQFSNFPRRILNMAGYSIPMMKDWINLEVDRRQTRKRIDDLRAGIFPAGSRLEEMQSNIEGLVYFCGAHKECIGKNMNPAIHQNDIEGWQTVEDAHLASMSEMGHGSMSDLTKPMDYLQQELEMREITEAYCKNQQLFSHTKQFANEEYLVGNEALLLAYAGGDKEIREILFKVAKHLVLEKNFEFDEIW